jgi:ADP-ribosylglycohydrolase
MADPAPRSERRHDPIAVLCRAAIEQAVMAAESPPHALETDAAYAAVSREMLRQAIAAAVEAGLDADTIARLASEAIVEASRARGSA